MNILFLDFDGPLFSDRCNVFEENRSSTPNPPELQLHDWITYWKMDPVAVAMINRLQTIGNFLTVVSSSWREFIDKDGAERLFLANGLNLPLHDDWRTYKGTPKDQGMYYSGYYSYCDRLDEIVAWIKIHEPKNYLILDDPSSGGSLMEKNLNGSGIEEHCVVLVDPREGISHGDWMRMLNIVKGWK